MVSEMTLQSTPVIAHSISSTVELDYTRGTARKTYEPPLWVRMLYRAAFQAPFPYAKNEHALEASRYRREIAGALTRYWFNEDVVATTLDVRETADGKIAFVTQLVEGGAPKDKKAAQRFLHVLNDFFLEAGMPTWQVTPYNPRAIGNLIETPDGTYRIIDLESNLVAPLVPLSGVIGLVRRGSFPVFDDIDTRKLNAYLDRNAVSITASLGAEGYDALRESARGYETSVQAWRKSEPRIISKALKFGLALVDVPSWIRGIRKMTAGSSKLADRFVEHGIEQWQQEGHVDEGQAEQLRQDARTPEVASALAHLGAHIAITIPLRFPLGSVARAAWTLAMRAQAEAAALFRGRSARAAREEHTLMVATASLVPGFGAAAYMLAKPLRRNRALAVIAFDQMLRKTPFGLYRTLHVSSISVHQAQLDGAKAQRRPFVQGLRDRMSQLRPHAPMIAGVLAFNAAVVITGAVIYVSQDTRVWFNEKGVMNSTDATQLIVAGIAGVAAWRAFWAVRGDRAPISEAAGIALWGITGAGMFVLAADDYFGVHEMVGDWTAATLGSLPLYTNTADDFITLSVGLTGLSILWFFRGEVYAPRASTTLLIGAAGMAATMVIADVWGHTAIRAAEFPAQVGAVGLLMLAHVVRWQEVRDAVPAPVAERRQVSRMEVEGAAA
jgi:hypothetical protein